MLRRGALLRSDGTSWDPGSGTHTSAPQSSELRAPTKPYQVPVTWTWPEKPRGAAGKSLRIWPLHAALSASFINVHDPFSSFYGFVRKNLSVFLVPLAESLQRSPSRRAQRWSPCLLRARCAPVAHPRRERIFGPLCPTALGPGTECGGDTPSAVCRRKTVGGRLNGLFSIRCVKNGELMALKFN